MYLEIIRLDKLLNLEASNSSTYAYEFRNANNIHPTAPSKEVRVTVLWIYSALCNVLCVFLRNNLGGPDNLTRTFGFNIPIATYLPFLEDMCSNIWTSTWNTVFVVADWVCFQHLVCWQVLYSVVIIIKQFPFLTLRLLLQVWYFCSVPHKVLLHLWQGDWIPRERYFSQTNG